MNRQLNSKITNAMLEVSLGVQRKGGREREREQEREKERERALQMIYLRGIGAE